VPLVIDPSAPGDAYTVEAVDNGVPPLETTTEFIVVDEASITITPDEGLPETLFDVSGEWFTAVSTVTITFDGTELVTGVLTLADGSFSAVGLVVPDLDPGVYTVTATDADNVYATGTYTILPPPSIVIETRATEYSPGDTVSFYIRSTTGAYVLEIEILDPTGYPFKTLTPALTLMNGWYGVLYAESSFVLPSDYEAGIWTWTAVDIDPVPDVELATGTFTVGEPVGPEPEFPAEISGVATLDPAGAPKTIFAFGETVLASADVINVGTVSQPMLIVFQLTDPEYRALAPNYASITLPPGLNIGPRLSFPLPLTGYAAGTWTVKVFVLDAWPAQGGVTIGTPVTITFTVTG